VLGCRWSARPPPADALVGEICMTETPTVPQGVGIRGAIKPGYEKVLTPEAITFAVELERKFGAERRRLLVRRRELQQRLDAGWKPDFLPENQGDPRCRLAGGADTARP